MLDPIGENILAAALSYCRAGYSVVPVKGRAGKDTLDAKRPIVKWQEWQGKRPTEETIKEWFGNSPLSDIAIVTGPEAGVLLLDEDGTTGGESLKDRQLHGGACVKTPRGRHRYYNFPESLKAVASTRVGILPGVDCRGKGGIVVIPPSVGLGDSGYKWESGEDQFRTRGALGNPPEWLVQLLLKEEAKAALAPVKKPESWFAELWQGCGEGDRHKALTRLVSVYCSKGLGDEDVTILMNAWNERCDPPKDRLGFAFELEGMLKYWREGRYRALTDDKVKTAFSSLSLSDFMARSSKTINWLVEGIIPMNTVGFIHGWGGLGKSWITLELAKAVARKDGKGKFLGRDVAPGKVLYVDLESGDTLLSNRVDRICRADGLDFHDTDINIVPMQKDDEGNSEMHLDQPECVDGFKNHLLDIKPSLVVIDPFVACHGLNENKTEDMAKLRRILKGIANDCKTSILFIDHEKTPSGNDLTASQYQRGSGEKTALADWKMRLSEVGGALLLEHSKVRYGTAFHPMRIKIEDLDDQRTRVVSEEVL